MLSSKDLIIRKSIIEDINYFYKWELKPEVSDFFSIDTNQSYDTVVRTFVHDDEDNFKRQYTMILKETDEPIGRIVLNDIISKDCILTIIQEILQRSYINP